MAKRARTTRGRRKSPNSNGSNGNGSHRLFDDVLSLASTLVRGRKESGADKLMTLAASTRDFAASLSDMPNLRQRASFAAESLEGLSDYVLHTEIDQMVDDANVFARRHPVMTVGLLVGAGLAAGGYLRTRSHSTAHSGRQARTRSSTAPRTRKQSRRKTDDKPGASA